MKRPIILTTLFLSLTAHVDATASVGGEFEDSVIRVLLVTDAFAGVDSPQDNGERLRQTWIGSTFTAASEVEVVIVNFGFPLVFIDGFEGGSDEEKLQKIRDFASSPVDPLNPLSKNFRDFYGADIVVGFVPDLFGTCGIAPQKNWIRQPGGGTPSFEPNIATGLDLRRADDDYVALVSADCTDRILAHEFGHLLGAGHYDGPTSHDWLKPNSKAWGFSVLGGPGQTINIVTAVAGFAPSFCNFTSQNCQHAKVYSDFIFGSSSRRNADAIDLTAKSVASYIIGAGPAGTGGTPPPGGIVAQCSDGMDNDGDALTDMADPDCSNPSDDDETGPPPPPPPPGGCSALVRPFGVSVSLDSTCLPPSSASGYLMEWEHACPGAVAFYQVFGAQPVGTGFFFLGQTIFQEGFVTIEGPPGDGEVRVRSCNASFACSGLSTPSVVVFDQC